jgi:FAD/FMN-containing dehydrogenase
LTEPPLPADLRARLAAALPPDALSDDPDDLAEYGRDWTKVYAPAPSVIAFPRSTAEVAAVLAPLRRRGRGVVPPGGRTGLAGGRRRARAASSSSRSRACADGPGRRARRQTVHVEAGAVTEAVHQHCAPHGLTWPVDFASKGSSQVGGNIATNAGGVKVIRYGLTRQWVLGLVVVTARGDVLRLNGALEKNNTGLDLRQLFIGTEGTLGVITEATLKLTRLPPADDVLLLGVSDLQAVLALFARRGAGPSRERLRVLHRRVPRAAAAAPQAPKPPSTRPAPTTCCWRSSPRRPRRARRLGREASSKTASRSTGPCRRTAPRPPPCGPCARASPSPSRPPASRTRTTSPSPSPRSIPSARSSAPSSRRATPTGRSASSATSATATSTST